LNQEQTIFPLDLFPFQDPLKSQQNAAKALKICEIGRLAAGVEGAA
jgi:hypothetical protein